MLYTALIDENAGLTASPYRFDQYELITRADGTPVELGRGAMGVTYKALDTNLRCEVALKVIHPRYLADESSRARFLSEARAAAQMRHRNIASVFHLGGERGEYFYAMELLEGETIEQRVLRKGPIDCATALDITLQITRALIATGNRRFVHRDIKPSNIMLCSEADGAIVAKLIDFGLVRAISDQAVTGDATPTRDGFIGTPHFASPEQFAGHPTDARADIFSLGVTLWFMLTARLPFNGMRDEVQQQQLSGALPLDHFKGIPRAVVDLIKRMLAVDPAKRPQSPAALKEQLNNCMVTIDRAKNALRRRFTYGALAAVLITGLIAVFYVLPRKFIPNPAPETAPAKSIAVLPFENLSDEKEHTFFADGVQDDVLTKLAKVADLKVINRNSVMQYRGRQDSRRIGRELGVSHVLEGTARRSGGKVHVNAQLVDTRTGMSTWAEEYERDLDEVFAVESELAQAIANQLRASVSARELLVMQERPTQDLIAYDLYIRAKNLLARTGTESSKAILLSAIDVLDQAVERDPTFHEAYCLLGWAHYQIYFLGLDHTSARVGLADAAVQAASRLRPDAGETHLARAWKLYFGHLDYDGALAELEIAHQTLPNNAQIPRLAGLINRRQGRWKESMQNLERAVDLDPRDAFTLVQICYSYGCLRRYAEKQLALERACAIEPNDVGTKVARAIVSLDWKADTQPLHRTIDEIRRKSSNDAKSVIDDWLYCALAERNAGGLTEVLAAAGETSFNLGDAVILSRPFVEGIIARMMKEDDKAQSAFIAARVEQEKITQAQPNYAPAFCALGLIDAALGHKEDALREGHRAVALLPVEKDAVNGPLMIEYLAMIAAWIGDKDLACQQLAIVVHRPSNVGYGELKLMPYWDPLRGDPCFEKLVEEAKQPVMLQ